MPIINSNANNANQSDSQFDERSLDAWNEAAERFISSSKQRDAISAKIEQKGLLQAEDKRRVKLRETLFQKNDAFALERVLGTNDLLDINYLSRGIRAAQSVCRIHVMKPNGRPDGFGTGFMISPNLLLTNEHVLPAAEYASRSLAEFNFEYDEDYQPRISHCFNLAPERFFYNNKKLDFALVEINPLSRSGISISEFGFLQLTESSGKALVSEYVSIIQHPNGSYKNISVRNNRILNRFKEFIHYEADTMPGSSGSPVFNDDWIVVALHHSGVPKRNTQGKIIKKDGKIWQKGEPDHLIDWEANEGVRISSIFNDLKKNKSWDKSEARILEELGTYSNSDLNESIIKSVGGATILFDKSEIKRANEPSVPHLKISKLVEKLEDPEVSELDLSPYFVLSDKDSKGMDPLFEINQELIILDEPQLTEGALLLNSANWICKRSRQKKYRKKINKKAKIKIISEGDSWFQYPFILQDIIDHLMAEPDFAILSFGEAGDLIRDVVAKAEFTNAIQTEQPDFFLISGGGNDLLADEGIKKYLNEPKTSLEPHHLIDNIELARFKARLASDYTNLISIVLKVKPEINIICHGYSYPIPNSGRWLGKPMEEIGITDRQLQNEIMRIIFDDINESIERTAGSFPQTVHYLDLKNVVPARGWFDELHPTNPFFGDVAAVFKEKIFNLC